METAIATVVFPRKKDGRIGLALKKTAIHTEGKKLEGSAGFLNGSGGKQIPGESVLACAARETEKEMGIRVRMNDLAPIAHIKFFWPGNGSETPDMEVYFFFLNHWEGEFVESEEMGKPHFYDPETIPYDKVMPSDRLFFPRIFRGERLVGVVRRGEKFSADFFRVLAVPV